MTTMTRTCEAPPRSARHAVRSLLCVGATCASDGTSPQARPPRCERRRAVCNLLALNETWPCSLLCPRARDVWRSLRPVRIARDVCLACRLWYRRRYSGIVYANHATTHVIALLSCATRVVR